MRPAAAVARGAELWVALAEADVVCRGAPEEVEVAVLMVLLPDFEAEDEPLAEAELVFDAVDSESEELGAPDVTVLDRAALEDATVLELSMTKYGV